MEHKMELAVTLVLLFVLLNLKQMYSLTNKFFGKLVGQEDPMTYGTGFDPLVQRGFLLHVLVFAAAVMYLLK